jgi:uncharacterized protein (DUF983 family)
VKHLLRAFRLRCPNCGTGRLFASWLKMRTMCDQCGLIFDRGEKDYFIGAYTLNLIVAELIVVFAILIGMVLSWPDVPWNTLMYALLPLAVLGPFLTYPYSRSVWLALDLKFRPPEPSDFAHGAHP